LPIARRWQTLGGAAHQMSREKGGDPDAGGGQRHERPPAAWQYTPLGMVIPSRENALVQSVK